MAAQKRSNLLSYRETYHDMSYFDVTSEGDMSKFFMNNGPMAFMAIFLMYEIVA
jgi:hypothetical protein